MNLLKRLQNLSLIICSLLVTSPILAQTSFLRDINNTYNVTVPPNTTVGYVFTSSVNTAGCTYNWTSTNASGIDDNATIPTAVNSYFYVWKNVNGNASAKVTLANCNDNASNGVNASYSVPIRYLGPIGGISVNPSNPLACGVRTVVFSSSGAQNATTYTWNYSRLQSQGWTYVSGNGTTQLTMTSSAGTGENVSFTATRNDVDADKLRSATSVTVTRPTLSVPTITGNIQGCYNQSGNYNLSTLPPGVSTIWSVSGPLSLASSTTNGALINYGGNDGFGTISAQITDGCNNTATGTLSVGVGIPNISTIKWDGNANSGPVPANSGSTHYFNVSSSNAPSANYSLNVSNNYGNINTSLSGVNGGNAQVYVYGSYGNSAININGNNVCGNKSSTFIIYIPSSFRASPNPAKESLTIAFTDTKYQEALPDQLEIISEKTSKIVRSINVREVYDNHKFQENNKIEFDVKDLPRGVYYLKIINPRQEKDKQVETVRLVFE